ncbi:MAG: hypothetical protein GY805_37150 [Chloroflexi bacterium]|nr:hypothetical protein [Chloroflexota bacterium]
MNEKQERTHSQMFTLRVWVEDVGNGRVEYRGTIKHLLSGETHHFRDWLTLPRHLEAAFALNQKHEPGE